MMSVAVRAAVSSGFSVEQGIEAESMIQITMGESAAANADIILQYLISTYGVANF